MKQDNESSGALPPADRATHEPNPVPGFGQSVGVPSATERFIEAIHEKSPNGEWVAVKHHPNGDWSVSDVWNWASRHGSIAETVQQLRDIAACGALNFHPRLHKDEAVAAILRAADALASLPDEIDLYRIIRRAGRTNVAKAEAVAEALGTSFAQAIEARSGETGTGSTVGESAVPTGCAQPPSLTTRGAIQVTTTTPRGTFACPICGKDTPHTHSAEEIEDHRLTEAWVEESWQQMREALGWKEPRS